MTTLFVFGFLLAIFGSVMFLFLLFFILRSKPRTREVRA